MAVRQEIIDAFQKDIELKESRVIKGKITRYREQYLNNKKRGDYSIVVDEWDKFQMEREAKKMSMGQEYLDDGAYERNFKDENKNIKGEINMSKRRLVVRLSKDYNVAEVEVSEIENANDFYAEALWAKEQALGILESYNTGTQKQTQTQYVEKKEYTKEPVNGIYEEKHITTKFLKGKQVLIALKAINSGKITIDQVNNLQSWDEQQALLFPPRKY